MEVTIQGEVLCEECTTALSANALPAIAAAADGVHSAGREGGGGRVGGLDREREQLSALADEVRYGQAAVHAGDTLVRELQQAMRRHRAATARRLALVQKEIDEVLVTHSLLETEAEEVEAIARGVTGVPPEEGDSAVEEADAWARAMLLAEEVAATELAIEKEEAELVAETGGDAKLFMDGAEATVMKGIVAALSGKPTRRQLSTPPEPEPEPEPEPAPTTARSRSTRLSASPRSNMRRRQAVSNPLVLAVFAEVEERKAQLPALLRRQDPGGSGRLGRRQLGEALGAAGVKLSADR